MQNKNNFGFKYSDYESLPKISLKHYLLTMIPYRSELINVFVHAEFPIYLHNIITNYFSKKYNVQTCVSKQNEYGKKYFFEMVGFQYHYQFKINPEFEDKELTDILMQFVKDWNHEYVTCADNMIIVNKKYDN